MKKGIYLIGGGGHAASCIDVIESTGQFEILGIFDLKENIGKKVLGYKIIGTDSDIKDYIKDDVEFVVTIGQIQSPEPRERAFSLLQSQNAKIATVISPLAYVSKHSKIGEGTIVFHHSLINCDVVIGHNCIINSKSLIEHSSTIGNHCHISTAAVVNGDCKIEEGSFIGSNCVLEQSAKVPKRSLLKAGTFHRIKNFS